MSSKKKGGKKGKTKKGNKEIEELRSLIDALKKEMDSMSKTIKKQNKRISSLETENKRINKKITKLMLGGSSGSLIAPQPSADATSDIEVKEEEKEKDSKSSTKLSIPTKQKRGGRHNNKRSKSAEPPKSEPLKPKKKEKKIRFTFDLNHQKIKIGDNGAAAMKPKIYGGTIRFGRFLHFTKNNNDNVSSYIINFDTRSIGQNSSLGIGFATTSFNQWTASNFGDNNSCLVKGNGQFLTTERVFKTVENKEYAHKKIVDVLLDSDNPKNGFYCAGQEVSVQVDLKNFIGKIWNNTLNKDGENNEKVFEIKLPQDYEICIAVYMGGSAKKKLLVKDQQFTFDNQE